MYCRNCGEVINPEDLYCSKCGNKNYSVSDEDLVRNNHEVLEDLEDNVKEEKEISRRSLSILLLVMLVLYISCYISLLVRMNSLQSIALNIIGNNFITHTITTINVVYISEIVVLVFCFIGIAKKRLLSWWYILISCAINMIYQFYLLSNLILLSIIGRNIIYLLLLLETIICTLLVKEYKSFVLESNRRRTEKEKRDEENMVFNCDSLICPKCYLEYEAKFKNSVLEKESVLCPHCGYILTKTEFQKIYNENN